MLKQGDPTEELLDLSIDELKRSVRVGSQLSLETQNKVGILLRDNKDIFAWTHEDMPKD